MITYANLSRRLFSLCYYLVSKNRRPCYSLANGFFHLRLYTNLQAKLIFLNNNPTKSIISRHISKSKKNKFAPKGDDSDEDESDGDDNDEFEEKGVEIKTLRLPSLRIDFILKTAFACNRRQIEQSFYETKIRVNGRLLLKKGTNVKVGDEVDIIKGFASENPDFLTVGRIEIISIGVDTENDKFVVKVKKSNSLLIDNYSDSNRWRAQESEVET